MSDEKPTPTYDQLVEATMKVMLEEGMVERAEKRLRSASQMEHEEIEDLVSEAQMRLVSNAPQSVRASFDTVVAFHRWNAIYKEAMHKGALSMAMDAQKHIDRLMSSIH